MLAANNNHGHIILKQLYSSELNLKFNKSSFPSPLDQAIQHGLLKNVEFLLSQGYMPSTVIVDGRYDGAVDYARKMQGLNPERAKIYQILATNEEARRASVQQERERKEKLLKDSVTRIQAFARAKKIRRIFNEMKKRSEAYKKIQGFIRKYHLRKFIKAKHRLEESLVASSRASQKVRGSVAQLAACGNTLPPQVLQNFAAKAKKIYGKSLEQMGKEDERLRQEEAERQLLAFENVTLEERLKS